MSKLPESSRNSFDFWNDSLLQTNTQITICKNIHIKLAILVLIAVIPLFIIHIDLQFIIIIIRQR